MTDGLRIAPQCGILRWAILTFTLTIDFRKIGDLKDPFFRLYIICTRSQRVAATVLQNPI